METRDLKSLIAGIISAIFAIISAGILLKVDMVIGGKVCAMIVSALCAIAAIIFLLDSGIFGAEHKTLRRPITDKEKRALCVSIILIVIGGVLLFIGKSLESSAEFSINTIQIIEAAGFLLLASAVVWQFVAKITIGEKKCQ